MSILNSHTLRAAIGIKNGVRLSSWRSIFCKIALQGQRRNYTATKCALLRGSMQSERDAGIVFTVTATGSMRAIVAADG